MKRSLGAGEWICRGLGVAVPLGMVAIATGLDTGLHTKLSLGNTTGLEEALLSRARPSIIWQASGVVCEIVASGHHECLSRALRPAL